MRSDWSVRASTIAPERTTKVFPHFDREEAIREDHDGSGFIVIVYDNDKNTWD